jgi:hypothetical protein
MEELVILTEVNPVPPWIMDAAMVVFSASLGFLAQRYFASRKELRADATEKAEDKKATLFRIAELETKLALVNAAVVPISTAFQAILIKELTHAHFPEMDELMVKIGPPNALTEEEELRLAHLLRERASDMSSQISDSERGAAFILPTIMERVRKEEKENDPGENLLVAIPKEAIPETHDKP